MSLDSTFEKLKASNEEVPKPLRLPSADELEAIECELNVQVQKDLRRYFLEVSHVVHGTIEPATITDPNDHTYWPDILKSAQNVGVPDSLLPFCEDNGDFYCLDQSGAVKFWSHNGTYEETWNSLAAWIEEVWLSDA